VAEEDTAIARLKRGEIDGLEPLVRLYQAQAIRAAYFITHDAALADDVMQAAFLKVWERIGQFDDRRPFGPWFLTIVTRDAVRAVTRASRHLPFDTPSDTTAADAASSDPVMQCEQAETTDELWILLGQLPPAQRAAVVQRYYLGMTEAEMVAATGVPAGTVKWRLHAARERLRRLLRAMVGDGGIG